MKNLIKILLILIYCYINTKTIYIIPPGGYENEKLFTCVERNNTKLNRDNCVKHFYDLRSFLQNNNHDLKTINIGQSISPKSIVITSGLIKNNSSWLSKLKKQNSKIIAFIWEPITTEPNSYSKHNTVFYDKIYTMWDDQVDNKKFFKLFYPHPNLNMIENTIQFHNKKFLTLISSRKTASGNKVGELYSERLKSINFFRNKKEIEFTFYGNGWIKQKGFGGRVNSKKDVLKNYKFCICFENTKNMNGYITEKIFDCFEAGCVPIYYGAPNIIQYIPENCFIDFRKFKNYKELLKYLKSIDENKYNNYIQNIKNFLNSEKAYPFSIENYINTSIDAIKEFI